METESNIMETESNRSEAIAIDGDTAITSPLNSITLQLGDVIEIVSPANDEYHETTNYISYIDNTQIRMTNVTSLKDIQLNINEEGSFTDESIQQIILLSRSDEKGYAKQNNLLPNVWVNIYFGGEIPAIIAGQISNLEEDMIEIITYPEMKTIYIDFQYQGIPLNIPIDKIVIREKPASLKTTGSLAMMKDAIMEGEEYVEPEEKAVVESTDLDEYISNIPEGKEEDKNIRDVLHDLYVDANAITFGEDLDEIVQLVEVPEGEQRYSLDVQINDMMEELLSSIPNSQRTTLVLDNIHTIIERYTNLRELYSRFDENNNVYDKKINSATHKPLVDKLYNLNTKLNWIIPVVSNRKKLNIGNTDLESNDIIAENMEESFGKLHELNKKYMKKGSKDNAITYEYMQKREQEVFRPFENSTDTNCLTTKSVLENIDAVVDNLNDFYSTVYAESGLKRTRFVIQRYNLGISKLQEQVMKSGKKVFVRESMTPNDEMSVKSFLMLPTSVIKFSEINLPSTSIMNKASLHNNYLLLYRLLKSNTEITSQVIDDFSNELDYEKIESDTKQAIFEGINEFVINNDSLEGIEYMNENEKFHKFLEVIVPKTRLLIKIYRKYIKNRLSFVGVVQKLEPFMVYPNDITYKQYMEIRYFIKEQIKELKKKLNDKSSEMRVLSNSKYDVLQTSNILLRILSERNEFAETFFKSYKFLSKEQFNTKLTPAEMLLQMMSYDNTELYTSMIASILISLNSADNLLAIIQDANIDELENTDKIRPVDCTRRYLSKKYTSVKDLQKDNNVDELYFDDEYDDTPYSIMEKYEKEKKEMPNDTFFAFLIENLIQRHSVSPENTKELAEALISKKKKILTGHYAVLEISSDVTLETDDIDHIEIVKKVHYYRRMKNNWVRDEDIGEERFLDSNTLFCNLSEKCGKNETNKICETDEQTKIRIKNLNKDVLENEAKTRHQISSEELEKQLTQRISVILKRMRKNDILRELQIYKANNLAYEIGKLAKKNDTLDSPHIPLRELIMGQEDFSKKQTDICTFVDVYCREAMVDNLNEEQHWYYCKNTNTKLFPVSIHRLAQSYVTGDNYQEMLERVCNEVGTEGDDGEAIVDKYSGYVLRKKDLSTEEGYDTSGRKTQTRDIMEKDLGVVMEESTKKRDKIFENELTETLYNVLISICNNIDIPIDPIEESVLKYASVIIEKNILSESAYNRRSEANVKKNGKSLGPYQKYKNETILTILGAVLHIVIQTATPSFKTQKTFPSCVRSFSGYPMTGMEDLSGINYISCVIVKMKSSIPPWDSMKSMKSDRLSVRIKDIIEKYIMTMSNIQELYVVKKEYMLLHPELVAPEELQIQKWLHFLPALVHTNVIKSLKNVSSDFKRDMIEKMKKGDPRQTTSLMMLHSKNVQHGYAIIEAINDIVKEKDQLLKTASQIPFLENGCCNEDKKLTNPIVYFNEENGNIKLYLQRIVKNGKTINDINKLTSPRMFNHDKPTGLKYPDLPTGYLEENVYHAFIHYCNFDRNLPIPNALKSVCNSAPDGYNSNWSLHEKMEYLKRNGKQFSVNQLQQMMTIVRAKHSISTFERDSFTQVSVLTDLLENFETMNSQLFEEPLRKHLRNVLTSYEPQKMKDTASPELTDLSNYLIMVNRNLYRNIMEFFDTQANTISSREFNKMAEFLLNIQHWEVGDNQLHTVAQFLKTAILNISKVYPTLIANKADFYKYICKHWPFSDNHKNDISQFNNKYYNKIEKFKGDEVLVHFLKEINSKLIDMSMFVSNLPIQTNVNKLLRNEKDELTNVSFHSLFDELSYYELMKYCFYRMIAEFIHSSDDVELLRTEIKTVQNQRRENNDNLSDPINFISSERNNSNEAVEQIANDMEENEIIMGTTEDLKSRISTMLYTFLEVEMENKNAINFSYDNIMKRVNRAKEREKKSIIDYLGNMSKEERKVEELFKTYKLGRWNVGQQKGLTQYDKETYERERSELLTQLYADEESGQYEVVSEMRREVFDLEKETEDEQEKFYDNEANNIEELGEDYMDGHYYAEDEEDEL